MVPDKNNFIVCLSCYLLSVCGSFLVACCLVFDYPRITFYCGFPMLFVVLEYIGMALRGQTAGFISSRVVVVLLCGLVECIVLEWFFRLSFLMLPAFMALSLLVVWRFLVITSTLSRITRFNVNARSLSKFSNMESLSLFLIVTLHQLLNGNISTFLYALRFNPQPRPVECTPPIEPGLLGLAWFNGEHSKANIASYAFLLGLVGGLGLFVGIHYGSIRAIGFFFMFLSLFHTLEYVSTARYRKDASLKSFILNHSRSYHIAMSIAFIEYIVEIFMFPGMKIMGGAQILAFIVVCASQALRTSAMMTAGSNFNHYVQYEKEKDHTLVKTGVYSVFRHPSYTGFFYWGICMQIMLTNPLSFIGYAWALHSFFRDRIEVEEETLIDFFEQEYIAYRNKTIIGIPFI